MAHTPQTSTKQTMQNNSVAGGRLGLFQKGVGNEGYCIEPNTIAATVTPDYLASPYNNTQGLQAGDKTCLSASHFASTMQAVEEGKLSKEAVPRVHLHASQDKALETVSYKDLKKYAAEPEATTQQGRQESHHDPASNRGGVAKEHHSIGGDQGTLAPGKGGHWKWADTKSGSGGQRG